MNAQLCNFVCNGYVNNPFIYNRLDVYFIGLKVVLLIKDSAGICQGNSLKYILIVAKWKQACIFLLQLILKPYTTFIGVSSKF